MNHVAMINYHTQNHYHIALVQVSREGSKPAQVETRLIGGMLLIERPDFLRICETKSVTDRLVNAGVLTSYYSNGTKKERRNGRLDNKATYYDLKEWQKINYNLI